jgi:hypothetical protein
MDGLPFDIEGGDAGGCQHRHFLLSGVAEIAQQCRFTRTGAAGNEDAPVAILQHIEGMPELFVDVYFRLFMFRVCHRLSMIFA